MCLSAAWKSATDTGHSPKQHEPELHTTVKAEFWNGSFRSIIWFSTESNRVFISWKVLYRGEQTILRSQRWNKCFTIDLLQRRQSLLTLVFPAANIKMHLTPHQTVKVCVHVTEHFCHKHSPKHKGCLHFHPHTVASSLHFMAQRTSKQWDTQTPELEQGRLVGHCGVL